MLCLRSPTPAAAAPRPPICGKGFPFSFHDQGILARAHLGPPVHRAARARARARGARARARARARAAAAPPPPRAPLPFASRGANNFMPPVRLPAPRGEGQAVLIIDAKVNIVATNRRVLEKNVTGFCR